MEKPIPAIATRALLMLQNQFQELQNVIIREMADVSGVDLKEGWKLNQNATAFVKSEQQKGGDSEP